MYCGISKYLVHYPYYLVARQSVSALRRYFEGTQWLSADELKERQWARLKQVLTIVYETLPFYKRKFDGAQIHPDDIHTQEDLLGIPYLTKEEIANNVADLVRSPWNGKVFARKTSGSTGLPLRVLKDHTSMAVMDAIMYRNYGWYGIDIGQKQARYWGSPLNELAQRAVLLKDFLLNRIRFSPFDISEQACRDFRVRLLRFQPHYVYGYAQTIYRFSQCILNMGLDVSMQTLKTVIVTGEMTTDAQIRTIETAFGCNVSIEYGCTEAGVLAMTCPNKGLHLMAENLRIEIVSNGRNSLPGQEGDIIITELFGKVMPLIRYKVGDRGVATDTMCSCGRGLPLLQSVSGRSDEFIVCADGRQVDPIIFEYVLHEIPEPLGRVTQFRITQEKTLHLDVEICYVGTSPVVMVQEIERLIRKIIGHDLQLSIRLVDSVTPEVSGKLRCFISRIKE